MKMNGRKGQKEERETQMPAMVKKAEQQQEDEEEKQRDKDR